MREEVSPSNVTVVVVSYNTKEKLRQCLGCIEAEHEVIVVDNASSDGSADMVRAEFPNVRLVENTVNRGFGEANDQGIALASRPHVLLLNSDAYAEPGAIAKLSSALIPGVVAAGGRQLNPDGSLQDSTANSLTLWAVFCEQSLLERAFPHSALFSPYWNTKRLNGLSETEQVMGATMIFDLAEVRSKADASFRPWKPTFEHEGVFDPRYFLYCEDTDLCYRLRGLGKIVYVPEAKFIHDLGSSSHQDRWRSVARYNRGKELYFGIHHGATSQGLCWLMDRAGALLRLAFWLILFPRSNGRIGLFWRVLTAPIQGPPDPRRPG